MFTHDDIRKIIDSMQFHNLTLHNHYICAPETALGLVLYRLAALNRYKEDMVIFQQSRSWLSIVFNDNVLYLINNFEN